MDSEIPLHDGNGRISAGRNVSHSMRSGRQDARTNGLAGGLWENQFSFPCFTGSLGKQGFSFVIFLGLVKEEKDGARGKNIARALLFTHWDENTPW